MIILYGHMYALYSIMVMASAADQLSAADSIAWWVKSAVLIHCTMYMCTYTML